MPELQGAVPDVDLSTDTTLADVQTYYAGLSDPATEDPFLASWLDQFVASFPTLASEGSDAAAGARRDRCGNAVWTHRPSAFAAIADIVDYLEQETPVITLTARDDAASVNEYATVTGT
ncbi:MAG: hypothetical protein R3D01_02355 [Hyphomicrobiales bacterium]